MAHSCSDSDRPWLCRPELEPGGPRGAVAQCCLTSEDRSGLTQLLQEQTKLASSALGTILKLRRAGSRWCWDWCWGGESGSRPKARLTCCSQIWGDCFLFAGGRTGVGQRAHGPGRRDISYHRGLPPQPPAILDLEASFSSGVPPRGAAERAHLPTAALELSWGSAGGLLDLPLNHCGNRPRRARLPPPGSPSACGRPRTPCSAPGLQGDLLKQSPPPLPRAYKIAAWSSEPS